MGMLEGYGKMLGNSGKLLWDIVSNPARTQIEVAKNVLQGDIEGAGEALGRGITRPLVSGIEYAKNQRSALHEIVQGGADLLDPNPKATGRQFPQWNEGPNLKNKPGCIHPDSLNNIFKDGQLRWDPVEQPIPFNCHPPKDNIIKDGQLRWDPVDQPFQFNCHPPAGWESGLIC